MMSPTTGVMILPIKTRRYLSGKSLKTSMRWHQGLIPPKWGALQETNIAPEISPLEEEIHKYIYTNQKLLGFKIYNIYSSMLVFVGVIN